MKQNLDTLKGEIAEHLGSHGFTTFHGFARMTTDQPSVFWDTLHYPDFRSFLAAAAGLGIKLIVFHHREFTSVSVDDALDQLEEADLAPEERQPLEHRLQEASVYQGLTSAIELSFDHQGIVYLYEVQTDWYLEFLRTLDEIDSYMDEGEEEGEDEESFGGYFSRN